MSVSKVQRSKSVAASTIYVVWGSRKGMESGHMRATALSVVSPRDTDPMAFVEQVREDVTSSKRRLNQTINIIQSFDPQELDPDNPLDVEKAHGAALALASRLAPHCDVLIATHTDKKHVHNHILIANHDRETGKAAPKDVGNAWVVRKANDEVMNEFGLDVLEQHAVSYSRVERLAIHKGLPIEPETDDPADLTEDSWRDFLRRRVDELVQDERVIDAVDPDGGVAQALDLMEDLAPEYGISFSRRGSSGKRKRERSSFAVLDGHDKPLRIRKTNKKGSVKAATAGSRLGADYTIDGLTKFLLELHQQRLNELFTVQGQKLLEDLDLEEADRARKQKKIVKENNAGYSKPLPEPESDAGSERPQREDSGDLRSTGRVGREGTGSTVGERELEGLSVSNEVLRDAAERFAEYNRRDTAIPESSQRVVDELGVDGSDFDSTTDSHRQAEGSVDTSGQQPDRTPGGDDSYFEDDSGAGGRSSKAQRRRRKDVEQILRQAAESNDPKPSREDYSFGI